jgi:hypothetical protein
MQLIGTAPPQGKGMLRPCAVALLFLPVCACGAVPQPYQNAPVGRLTPRPERLLSDEEVRNNCAGLTIALRSAIERLSKLQKAEQEQAWPPPSLMSRWERPPPPDIAKERRRLGQFNAALEDKGCQTLNVDDELRKVSASPVTTAR